MRPIPTLRPWLIPAFTLGLAPGCGVRGNGESATDTRALGDFDAVDVAGGLLVFVTPNPAPSARVTCDENLLPYLVDCCHAYVTVGEMVRTLKGLWGEFEEPIRL